MNTCQQGCEFYFLDGVVVNNVDDLTNHIKDLSQEQYMHHVNAERNDFYNWIKDCIDAKAAKKIEGNIEKDTLVKKLTTKRKSQKK